MGNVFRRSGQVYKSITIVVLLRTISAKVKFPFFPRYCVRVCSLCGNSTSLRVLLDKSVRRSLQYSTRYRTLHSKNTDDVPVRLLRFGVLNKKVTYDITIATCIPVCMLYMLYVLSELKRVYRNFCYVSELNILTKKHSFKAGLVIDFKYR